jgi:hypothetical protein
VAQTKHPRLPISKTPGSRSIHELDLGNQLFFNDVYETVSFRVTEIGLKAILEVRKTGLIGEN